MSNLIISAGKRGVIGRAFLAACLVVLAGLLLPALVWADEPPPGYVGPEKCAECHAKEAETWRSSPHARAKTASGSVGVTCEDCHGAYVEGHPQSGVMKLSTDSSVCKNCHATIYEKWAISSHSQANVQCIGCHVSHSQNLRLADQALCKACHQARLGDFSHTAHSQAGVICTSCHVSSAPTQTTATGTGAIDAASSHDFTSESAQVCVNCHNKPIPSQSVGSRTDNLPPTMTDNQSPAAATTSKPQEQTTPTLKIMPLISLGLGMGVGGVLGIVFMLTVGYISSGRAKK